MKAACPHGYYKKETTKKNLRHSYVCFATKRYVQQHVIDVPKHNCSDRGLAQFRVQYFTSIASKLDKKIAQHDVHINALPNAQS